MAAWRREYTTYKKYVFDIYASYKKKRDIMMFMEILLSLATIALLAVFALRPTSLTIIGLVKEIRAKEDLIERMDTKIRNLSTAQSLYSSEARRIGLLNQAIPDKPNYDAFYKQLLAIHARNGVQVQTISSEDVNLVGLPPSRSSDESNVEGVVPIPLRTQSLGEYLSIKNLLTQLENLRRPYFLNQVSISPESPENPNTIIFSVSGDLFHFNPVTEDETQTESELEQENL